jgi:thioredoxin 1
MLSRCSILIAAFGASAAAIAPAFAAVPQPFDAEAFGEARRAGKPILVAIDASWCPTCKAQRPILGDLLAYPKFKDVTYFAVVFDCQKDLVKRFGAVRTEQIGRTEMNARGQRPCDRPDETPNANVKPATQ